jgi:DNA-directed RNA polymerase specialized sigma24 family protein
LREAQKEQQRERESLLAVQHAPRRAHDEQALRCLDRCLTTLTPENRELISRYYSGQELRKPADRQRLAEELGITVDALRTRALRIRRELELCITRCREKGDASL